MFSRMHETINKLNYLIHTTFEKHHVLRDLLRFLTQRFSGFHIVRIEVEDEVKTLYSPIDIYTIQLSISKIRLIAFFLTDERLTYI